MKSKKRDIEKERQWRQTIRDGARSGLSVREFCRRRQLKESQFYWWQRRLKASRSSGPAGHKSGNGNAASFALVSQDPGAAEAGIELVLEDGRRLRIGRGVDEQTLRAVLAAMETERC